jgi:hypothetical protein
MRESNDGKDGRAYTGVVDWVTGVIGVMVMGIAIRRKASIVPIHILAEVWWTQSVIL